MYLVIKVLKKFLLFNLIAVNTYCANILNHSEKIIFNIFFKKLQNVYNDNDTLNSTINHVSDNLNSKIINWKKTKVIFGHIKNVSR